jgi:hypothetical protein
MAYRVRPSMWDTRPKDRKGRGVEQTSSIPDMLDNYTMQHQTYIY